MTILGSIDIIMSVATEINAVNYSIESWLGTSHSVQGFFFFRGQELSITVAYIVTEFEHHHNQLKEK